MSELYFRAAPMQGFTAIELANKNEGYTTPIRELLQNSLDAYREIGNATCKVDVYIETIDITKIPFISDYKRALRGAIKTQQNLGSYNDNAQRVVSYIQYQLKQKKCKILMFVDNGVGMPQNRLDAILTGYSIKGSEESGGSFGVGHLSSLSLSALRYVLYATNYRDKKSIKSLFTGSAILAGHNEKKVDRGNRGRIVEKRPRSELQPVFTYPTKFPDFIKNKMNKVESGTLVAILGLTELGLTESWGEDAEYAIASNFFHAIFNDSLSITVHQKGSDDKIISKKEVEKLIERKKEGRQARGEIILSGKAVYHALRAVKIGKKLNKRLLTNGDKVDIYVNTDKEADSTIALIRNGMLIARHNSMLSGDMDGLRKNPDYYPFTAVINVDQKHAPTLFQLVKGAESPHHNKLDNGRLKPDEGKALQTLLKELCENIKENLQPVDRTGFELPLFPIPNKSYSEAGHADKAVKPNKRATTDERPVTPKPPIPPAPPIPPVPPIPPKPFPIIRNRSLKSKSAVRYMDKGNTWEVKLRITPNEMKANDDVYLSIFLAEDNDENVASTVLNFVSIAVTTNKNSTDKSHVTEVDSNKKSVNLGSLESGQQYNIVAEIEKPQDLGNMKMSLLPILGLKRRTKTAEKG